MLVPRTSTPSQYRATWVPFQDAGVLIVLGGMSLERYGRTRLSPGSNAGNAAKDPMGSGRLITIDCMGLFSIFEVN
jgi:hypothetical protein